MANNLKQVDINNLHLQSQPVQLFFGLFLAVLIVGVAYLLLYRSQLEDLEVLQNKEVELKQEYETKSRKAANLDVLKEELAQIRSAFDILVKQLPTDAEIPGLIQELHQAGATNGMRMNSVTPQAPVVDDSVQKLPYAISLSGSYEQLSQFTRDVGKLSRIVTLDTVNLRRANEKDSTLTLDAMANTYQAAPITEVSATPEDAVASAPEAQ
ncbi:type IV pilus assembly protein PilO [Neisseria sp. HSC-16F19]|nr:type 4a pilus biogenesis protein PilO [Neisseria sp. HSC-16F19]MCP2041255.1 type IV pilus assembly protein PilO [Neisseria sp. HSC-16F19]